MQHHDVLFIPDRTAACHSAASDAQMISWSLRAKTQRFE
jgi:hypothetical protein